MKEKNKENIWASSYFQSTQCMLDIAYVLHHDSTLSDFLDLHDFGFNVFLDLPCLKFCDDYDFSKNNFLLQFLNAAQNTLRLVCPYRIIRWYYSPLTQCGV